MSHVDLGFVEECEPWKLESRLFPSKIGGKPAWLDLENLPTVNELQCNLCNRQMIFLCQIYAPFEEDENNFHRTIFIFVCRNSTCSIRNTSNNIKVFRSHLSRQNKFYSFEAPSEEPDPNFTLSQYLKLCHLCGCVADKSCGKCKLAYCCKEHQVMDWKEGHKNVCGTNISSCNHSNLLFNECELIIESECRENCVKDEKEALQEYQKLEDEGNIGTMSDVADADLESHSYVEDDATFSKFRKRIDGDVNQVLRYERGGVPLWIANKPKPLDIPNCEYCNCPRQFEFQIMPQMLTILEENQLDWGILIIYSCKNSCTDKKGYKNEFVFRQDVSDNKTS